jgi:hypothetical protein
VRRERIIILGIFSKSYIANCSAVVNGSMVQTILECRVQERMPLKLWLPGLCRCRHAEPKRKQCTYVSDILQALQQRDEVQQIVVCWVANPAFDGNGIVCFAISILRLSARPKRAYLTWMEDVAQGAVIKNHDLAEIGLDLSKILDIGPTANSAVLPVVSPGEVLALHL